MKKSKPTKVTRCVSDDLADQDQRDADGRVAIILGVTTRLKIDD
jgi:hypothetical protein